MKPPRLYLFVGYPGAGKTTVAKLIESETDAVHLWADHERRDMFHEVTHSANESTELYKHLNDRTDALLAAGSSVIFDTNFNYLADREYLRQIAQKHDAEVLVIWMTTPKALAKQRATHPAHSDRNHHEQSMTEAEFDSLSDHLEAPTELEPCIKIDGTDIDVAAVKQQLGL